MAATESDEPIHTVLRHHDQQLASLGAEMNGVKATLGEHSQILRRIDSALTGLQATSPAGFGETVETIKNVFVLLGILVGAVIFITASFVNERVGKDVTMLQEQTRTISERVDELKELVGWAPEIKSSERHK